MSEKASLLPLPEELYLRSLTGRLVGENLFDGFKKVAVIAYPDRICSAMASSALTSFSYYTGYKDRIGAVFVYDENLRSEVRKIVDENFDAVYIAFGGEQKLSIVNQATLETLKLLRGSGYKNALAIHVRVWLATKQFSTVLSDESLRRWLESLPEIRVFTADLNNKKFLFHRVRIVDGKPVLNTFREALLTDEHVSLLKRSIPPPE
ncbi:MAG: hypothetical protein JHC19_00910 [Desulfurococcaceae archaeon]|nr:hypothetical protein [Desulfurococcaceae archaeon]